MMQNTLAENLLHWLAWQSLYVTVAAAVVLALIQLFKLRDPRILLGLWGLVLLRFFLPLDLALPWSARNQFQDVAINWVGTQEELRHHAQAGQRSAVQDVVTRVWLPVSAATPQQPQSKLKPTEAPLPWKNILLIGWLLGVTILAGLAMRQHLSLLALLRRSDVVDSAEVVAQVNLWRQRYDIRRPVTVLRGDVSVSPFTFGLKSPIIYMPAALLDSLTPAERDAVFGHELAHVRGFDMLWLLAERFVQIMFFFHPVAWIATQQLASARERCCDLQAITSGNMSPSGYWNSVLLALRKSQQDAPSLALAPSLGPAAQTLKHRIIAMKQAQPMTKLKWLGVVCGTSLLALVILPMARSENAKEQVRDTAPPIKFARQATAMSVVPPAPPPPSPAVPPAPPVVSSYADYVDVEARVQQAQFDADQQIAHAAERLTEAKAFERRIATGDLGNMMIVHNGKEVVCSPRASHQKDKCTRYMNAADIEEVRKEAAWDVEEATRELEQARIEAQQAMMEARAEAEGEAQRAAEEARAEAEQASAEAAAEARRALADAKQAQSTAYQRISEIQANARQVEIEALQDTLQGLRDAVREMRSDHQRELARMGQNVKSQQLASAGQIVANVIQSLEMSAQQVEQQLALARARKN